MQIYMGHNERTWFILAARSHDEARSLCKPDAVVLSCEQAVRRRLAAHYSEPTRVRWFRRQATKRKGVRL